MNPSLFASDLSQDVLEQRRRLRELAPPSLNLRNQRMYPLLAAVLRSAYPVDAEAIPDSFQGESKQIREGLRHV